MQTMQQRWVFRTRVLREVAKLFPVVHLDSLGEVASDGAYQASESDPGSERSCTRLKFDTT